MYLQVLEQRVQHYDEPSWKCISFKEVSYNSMYMLGVEYKKML